MSFLLKASTALDLGLAPFSCSGSSDSPSDDDDDDADEEEGRPESYDAMESVFILLGEFFER